MGMIEMTLRIDNVSVCQSLRLWSVLTQGGCKKKSCSKRLVMEAFAGDGVWGVKVQEVGSI